MQTREIDRLLDEAGLFVPFNEVRDEIDYS